MSIQCKLFTLAEGKENILTKFKFVLRSKIETYYSKAIRITDGKQLIIL